MRSADIAAFGRAGGGGSRGAKLSDRHNDLNHAQHDFNRRKYQIGRLRQWVHLFTERQRRNQRRAFIAASGYNAKRHDGRRHLSMDWAAIRKQTYLSTGNTRGSLPANGVLQRPRANDRDNFAAHNDCRKRYGLHLSLWALALLPSPAWGQVNATAAPSSVSNGSVTNQAVMVTPQNFFSYQMGPAIQCPGPTLSISPFVTGSHSYALPRREYQKTPFYDTTDANEDGVPDNPGDILFYQETPTGQKDSFSTNVGISATFTIPLDGGLAARCKATSETQRKLMEQQLAHKKLDYEIGRLKHCGQQAKLGVIFRPGSQAAQICADVVVIPKPGTNKLPPHKHPISAPENDAEPLPLDSYLSAPDVVQKEKAGAVYAQATP